MSERIQKVIAASGLASRRGAEDLIKQGRVTVNGKPAEIGQAVELTDRIFVNGKPVDTAGVATVAYLLNKPVGVVCSTVRQGKETIITDLVPKHPPVFPVGRLDRESGGLIILTNDGNLSQTLTHPSFGHKKTYRVGATWKKDTKPHDGAWIRKELLGGVKLGDGKAKADAMTLIAEGDRITMEITVHEGRHHLVRRMCAVLGLAVVSLVRVELSHLALDKLPIGGYRVLTKRERTALLSTHANT